jgi:hypothetical protein
VNTTPTTSARSNFFKLFGIFGPKGSK